MKVIVAGYPKTGTKSLNAALTELGYNVYDYLESFWFHYDDWKRIYDGEGSKEDFKKMYENVDAVIDHPALHFWKEIHDVFPDAKIILMTRDEESWFESFKNQMDGFSAHSVSLKAILYTTFLPTYRKLKLFNDDSVVEMTGRPRKRTYFGVVQTILTDKLNATFRYRRHNAYVIQEAPEDKLLVYDVKHGWEPLCKFLGKEIPSTPFPHKNVRGKDILPNQNRNLVGKQIEKETRIFFFVLVFIVVCAAWCSYFFDISLLQIFLFTFTGFVSLFLFLRK